MTLADRRLPIGTPAPARAAIDAAVDAWTRALGDRLVSVVLFGSVARGESRPSSDIDLLVVARGFPRALRDRRAELLAAWDAIRPGCRLADVEWNLVTKTPEEARHHSPLYLDMVEDAVLLVDRDGFFAAVLGSLAERMRALGSRRVRLPDGSWYWDLKPGMRFGEVVEL